MHVTFADGLTLASDVRGSDAVRNYFQSYWEKYEFSHSVIAGAVHSDDGCAFSFWQDKVPYTVNDAELSVCLDTNA